MGGFWDGGLGAWRGAGRGISGHGGADAARRVKSAGASGQVWPVAAEDDSGSVSLGPFGFQPLLKSPMAASRNLLQLSFVIHAVVYAAVIGGLVYINQATSSQHNWAGIVAWAWGIGLAAHGAVWVMLRKGSSKAR